MVGGRVLWEGLGLTPHLKVGALEGFGQRRGVAYLRCSRAPLGHFEEDRL